MCPFEVQVVSNQHISVTLLIYCDVFRGSYSKDLMKPWLGREETPMMNLPRPLGRIQVDVMDFVSVLILHYRVSVSISPQWPPIWRNEVVGTSTANALRVAFANTTKAFDNGANMRRPFNGFNAGSIDGVNNNGESNGDATSAPQQLYILTDRSLILVFLLLIIQTDFIDSIDQLRLYAHIGLR